MNNFMLYSQKKQQFISFTSRCHSTNCAISRRMIYINNPENQSATGICLKLTNQPEKPAGEVPQKDRRKRLKKKKNILIASGDYDKDIEEPVHHYNIACGILSCPTPYAL